MRRFGSVCSNVCALALSPDRKTLAWVGRWSAYHTHGLLDPRSPEKLGLLQLWDLEQERIILSVPTDMGRLLTWSPTGEYLALLDECGAVQIWKKRGSLLRRIVQRDARLTLCAWHPAGNVLACAGYGYERTTPVLFTCCPQDRELQVLQANASCTPHTSYIRALTYAGTGDLLASGDDEGRVVLWEMPTDAQPGVRESCLIERSVEGLQFSPDGTSLAVEVTAFPPSDHEPEYADSHMVIWYFPGQHLFYSYPTPLRGEPGIILGYAWHPGGEHIAWCLSLDDEVVIELWSTRNGACVSRKSLEMARGCGKMPLSLPSLSNCGMTSTGMAFTPDASHLWWYGGLDDNEYAEPYQQGDIWLTRFSLDDYLALKEL